MDLRHIQHWLHSLLPCDRTLWCFVAYSFPHILESSPQLFLSMHLVLQIATSTILPYTVPGFPYGTASTVGAQSIAPAAQSIAPAQSIAHGQIGDSLKVLSSH
jgi:hypothetical protein